MDRQEKQVAKLLLAKAARDGELIIRRLPGDPPLSVIKKALADVRRYFIYQDPERDEETVEEFRKLKILSRNKESIQIVSRADMSSFLTRTADECNVDARPKTLSEFFEAKEPK